MDITVQELKTRLDAGEEFTFIDVREPWEYEEFNLGATLIPLGNIMQYLDDLPEDKSAEIVIHCRSGGRSGQAQAILQSFGYTKVRNVLGGVLDWKANFG
jgi:rhodanese-related sulfurtransferase